MHVPFCASTCDFCAFYQEKPKREEIEKYLDGIELEMEGYDLTNEVSTIFWGGGTPGLLPAKDLERLGEATLKLIGQKPEEWTIEMAPSTVKPDKVKVLKDMGVTRISMGIQSFDDELLKSLGRLHSSKQIFKAWDIIKQAEFESANMDLMFSLPGQTMDAWMLDLEQAFKLDPEHISTYCLTFEEDTALYTKLSKGLLKIDTEKEADFYIKTWDTLKEAGYGQYEISNFSKPGHECTHNINTWKMHDWLGIGPSASSQYENKRFTNFHNQQQWLDAINAKSDKKEENSELNTQERALDAVIFGLRMNQGINLNELEQRFNIPLTQQLDGLLQNLKNDQLIFGDSNRLKLTQCGRMLADSIATAILEQD